LFRSESAGAYWTRTTDDIEPYDASAPGGPLVADPAHAGHVLAATPDNRVLASVDGGQTFFADTYLLYAPPNDIAALAIDPAVANGYYVCSRTRGLLHGVAGNWLEQRGSGLPANLGIAAIAVDPADPNIVLVGSTELGYLYRSTDAGMTFSFVAPAGSSSSTDVSALTFAAGTRVYAWMNGVLYRSNDSGVSWYYTIAMPTVNAILPDSSDPDSLIVGRQDGLYRSSDGGATFAPLGSGIVGNGTPAIRALTRATAGSAQLFAATDRAGVFGSSDGGQHWSALNTGFSSVTLRAVAVHPTQAQRLYGGATDASGAFVGEPLFVSDDGGTSWHTPTVAPAAIWIRALAIDPTTAASAAATTVYAAGLAPYVPGSGLLNAGLYKSTDGGDTWAALSGGGLPPSAGVLRNLAFDLRSCDTPPPSGPCSSGPLKTLYFTATGATSGSGRFEVGKSTDGGATWNDASTGLPYWIEFPQFEQVIPLTLLVDPTDSQVLYLGTFDEYLAPDPSDGPPGAPTLPNGVFRSSDGGAHWMLSSSGLPLKQGSTATALDVTALALDPQNPTHLWAALTDTNLSAQPPTRLFSSADAGANWTELYDFVDCDVRALKPDPVSAGVLYAGGYTLLDGRTCLYRSADGGTTWASQTPGLVTDAVLALDLDPQDPARILIGTLNGAFVWSNVPDAIFADGFDP
jgi:photosystem II stability/assembly factor-like uncharacterized protein